MNEKKQNESDVYFNFRNEKEIELIVQERSIPFHASLNKSHDAKTKKAIRSVTAQLNHFLLYLDRLDKEKSESDSDIGYLVLKFINLQDKLSRKKIDKIARERAEENYTNFNNEKVEYFREVLTTEFLYDDYLLKLISDYSYEKTKMNLEPSDIDKKLHYCDIHVFQATSVYSKILYILYFNISELISYEVLTKQILIRLTKKINDYSLDLFPKEYNIIRNMTFIDRLFSYIEFQIGNKLRSHQIIMNKFSDIGYSKEKIVINVLGSVLSALKKFIPILFKKDKKNKDRYFKLGKHEYDKWGYVAKNTVGLISRIIANTMVFRSKYTPKFGINSVDLVDGEGGGESSSETPESSKYERLLEKRDKEHYRDMKRLKNYIIEDSKKNGRLSDASFKDIEEIINKDTDITHLLNEFMVSVFLEQEYNVNVSNLLTYKEFLILVFRIFERLECSIIPSKSKDEGYQCLHLALISPTDPANRTNGFRINKDFLNEHLDFYNINNDRTTTIFNSIISRSYTYRTPNGHIDYLNVKKDFLKFIKNGMVI